MKKFILFLMPFIVLFSSCGKHSDGSSVWGGGLWLIPVVLFALALWKIIELIIGYNSGTVKNGVKVPGKRLDKGTLILAIIFIVAALASIFFINSER